MTRHRYLITSGWWCDEDHSDDRQVKFGASALRKSDFFATWYHSVMTNCDPQKIVIVDSASPVKPPTGQCARIHLISLDHNPGHATHVVGRHAGVTYSMVLGMMYALLDDVDYWVYIEQDALLHGRGIVDHAIAHMRHDIMFGSGAGTPQPMQQSFMILRREAIARFVQRLFRIDIDDARISPEIKFAIAASPLLNRLPRVFYRTLAMPSRLGHLARRLVFWVARSRLSGFSDLPFGYGRARPLSFTDPYFYFQHGAVDELARYASLEPPMRTADPRGTTTTDGRAS